jgi:hypothetical protein
MTTGQPRSRAERKADVLAKLAAPVADAWVATAAGGEPYLVPLTLAWHDERILLSTARTSATCRNIEAHGRARIALGGSRDVVMIEAVLDKVVPAGEAGPAGAAYAEQNDWDPRTAGESYVFLVLRPDKIQAWRELNELPGRTVMKHGSWLA